MYAPGLAHTHSEAVVGQSSGVCYCVYVCIYVWWVFWQPGYGELVRSQHTRGSLLPASLTTSGCVCLYVCVHLYFYLFEDQFEL